ncbi:MAG: FAD-binding protein [Saprospiraceae bacterium]|nr:FAD-binding protein [Saprospiraceae bacterium]
MKRKKFIKTSSLLLAGGVIAPYVACKSDPETEAVPFTNWARNYSYRAKNLRTPANVDELQALITNPGHQKALGSRHCFNDIADSPDNQISTALLNQVVNIDGIQKTMTVESGIRYGDFARQLDQQGYALHNLASLPHISVAGACATGTHGSGVTLGNLATPVRAIELVTPQGELIKLDREHPDFYGVVVGLGAFGILARITLDIENTYQVRQDVFQDLPLASMQNHFNEIMSSGYSVSLFTDWLNQKVSQVWIKRRTDRPVDDLGNDFYGAQAATRNLHPIVEITAENCTEQMGVPGPWYLRLPHFKMGFMPSGGEELQSEFYVPRDNAVDAILALEKKRDLIHPQLLITEIRTIAADDFWMSPCYHQDSVTIHFTWKQHDKEVRALLPMIESELAPFGVRPHWGKIFSVEPALLHQRYERFPDFLALAKKYDPEGKFRNHYLDLNVYA